MPFFPSAADARRQGFARMANRSARAAEVAITAYDDAGSAYETVVLALGAGETTHFNSNDLELGTRPRV